jgi:ribosomal protein L7/L12
MGMTLILLLVALVVIFLLVIFLQGGSQKSNGNFPDSTASGNQLSVREREEMLELLRQGKKIHAIKICRNLTGCGLKEAKEMVETLEREI